MLRAKKLWNPASKILRLRSLISAPPYVSIDSCRSSSQINSVVTDNSSFICSKLKTTPFLRLSLKNLFCSQSSVDVVDRCWSCNAKPDTTPFLFCNTCRAIQPVDHSVDYFQIFGLERKYDIEVHSLEGKYKDWQKKLHPDLVHSKSQEEKEYASDQSARVTNAYRTLTNPLSRAIYMLKVIGVDVDEEETITEPDLLAEIMEIREAVEEATDTKALNEIQSQMQERLNDLSKCFANAFQNQQYEEAKDCIRRMTYYSRVKEEIVKRL